MVGFWFWFLSLAQYKHVREAFFNIPKMWIFESFLKIWIKKAFDMQVLWIFTLLWSKGYSLSLDHQWYSYLSSVALPVSLNRWTCCSAGWQSWIFIFLWYTWRRTTIMYFLTWHLCIGWFQHKIQKTLTFNYKGMINNTYLPGYLLLLCLQKLERLLFVKYKHYHKYGSWFIEIALKEPTNSTLPTRH